MNEQTSAAEDRRLSLIRLWFHPRSVRAWSMTYPFIIGWMLSGLISDLVIVRWLIDPISVPVLIDTVLVANQIGFGVHFAFIALPLVVLAVCIVEFLRSDREDNWINDRPTSRRIDIPRVSPWIPILTFVVSFAALGGTHLYLSSTSTGYNLVRTFGRISDDLGPLEGLPADVLVFGLIIFVPIVLGAVAYGIVYQYNINLSYRSSAGENVD